MRVIALDEAGFFRDERKRLAVLPYAAVKCPINREIRKLSCSLAWALTAVVCGVRLSELP